MDAQAAASHLTWKKGEGEIMMKPHQPPNRMFGYGKTTQGCVRRNLKQSEYNK
jgi:hypothetical protein